MGLRASLPGESTLGAGAVDMGLLAFIAALGISRGVRYLGLALLCILLGERIKRYRIPRWAMFSIGVGFLLAFWALLTVLV